MNLDKITPADFARMSVIELEEYISLCKIEEQKNNGIQTSEMAV